MRLLEAVGDLAVAERRGKVARGCTISIPDAYLSGHTPDLLASRHLATTLPEVPDLVVDVYDRAGPARRLRLLSVLGRAGADEAGLAPVVRSFLDARLADLVDRARTHADPTVATLVVRLLHLAPNPQLAAWVVDALPRRSTSLAALAATLQEQATAHYRTLAEADPDAFLPDLATSLNNLSIRLADLGRRSTSSSWTWCWKKRAGCERGALGSRHVVLDHFPAIAPPCRRQR